MFDDLYSRLVGRVNYRILTVIPPLMAVLALVLFYVNGVSYGIEFQGGTWIEATTDNDLTNLLEPIQESLINANLTDLKSYVGYDIATQKNKLTVVTTSMVGEDEIESLLEPHLGSLNPVDTVVLELSDKPPTDLADKLKERFKHIDVSVEGDTVTIKALDLDGEEISSALSYYLGKDVEVEVKEKNLNMRSVGPTLGKTFREQGIKALFVAYLLMSMVVFFAFRNLVPSVAVLQAAVCDVIMAVGLMSLFNVPFDSASLGALLMLIGYSVDTDILLTARVLRQKGGLVSENIDGAMKTGLMMTLATIAVMVVTLIVTSYLIEISTLNTIALVLVFGLVADLFTTWFTNAGLIKWDMERPKVKKTRRRGFSIFGD